MDEIYFPSDKLIFGSRMEITQGLRVGKIRGASARETFPYALDSSETDFLLPDLHICRRRIVAGSTNTNIISHEY